MRGKVTEMLIFFFAFAEENVEKNSNYHFLDYKLMYYTQTEVIFLQYIIKMMIVLALAEFVIFTSLSMV